MKNKSGKIKWILIIILMSFQNIWAQKVNITAVQKAAKNFIVNYFPDNNREIFNIYTLENDNSVYVVELLPEGWILFSGDFRTEAVIGFSFDGKFGNPELITDHPFNYWMSNVKYQIKDVDNFPDAPMNKEWEKVLDSNALKKSISSVTVNNLIEVEWDQGRNYNQFCPEDEAATSGHVPVGCVAVSMAQSMSVFKFPAKGVGTFNYYHSDYGTQFANFGNTTYYWDSMAISSGDEFNARLLYHCAVSVSMDFGVSGSGSTISKASSALKKYFTYSKKTLVKNRVADDVEWFAILNNELLNGRSVIYSGDNNDGEPGHAWNLDGVLNGKYYHMNWGWGGLYNGYFSLSGLNPGSYKFNYDHSAVIGIQPVYYPTNIILEDSIVGFDTDINFAVGKLKVIDEAVDNIYSLSLTSDSVYLDGNWVNDFYLDDNDTVRSNRIITAGDEGIRNVYVDLTDQFGRKLNKTIKIYIGDSYYQSTGDSKVKTTGFDIYPNPVLEVLNLTRTTGYDIADIKVYSISGSLLMIKQNHKLSDGINVNELHPGMYILEISEKSYLPQKIKFIKN